MMLIEGLMLTDKEAAAHGIGAIYEDVIDSVWASLPTSKKVKLKVPTPDGDKIAILQWQEAEAMQPPKDTPLMKFPEHPIHRRRALRKKTILTDLLAVMRLLYREPQTGKMMDDNDDLDG
jgi:hypothetical protein